MGTSRIIGKIAGRHHTVGFSKILQKYTSPKTIKEIKFPHDWRTGHFMASL